MCEYPASINMTISAGWTGTDGSRGGALKVACTSLYVFNVDAIISY